MALFVAKKSRDIKVTRTFLGGVANSESEILLHGHRNTFHHHRLDGTIVPGGHFGDGDHDLERCLVGCLAKHRVLRFSWREEIKKIVVDNIHEKLAAAAIGLPGIGHGQGARLVGDLGCELVFDVATIGTCFRSPSLQILEGTVRRPAGASPLRKWVLAVWTAELIHEIWDHTVKVESIVEARIGEVDEIGRGDGHLLEVNLCFDHAHRGIERCNRVGHREGLSPSAGGPRDSRGRGARGFN